MAQFENVNYTFYTDTLGRSVVPDAAEFEKYKMQNVLQMRSYIDDCLVCEKMDGGIDSTVCMWIEEDYKAAQIANGSALPEISGSESIGDYSYNVNTKAYDVQVEKNAKSTVQLKHKWLELYCYINVGVS